MTSDTSSAGPATDALAAARACLQSGDLSAATRLAEAHLELVPRDGATLQFLGMLSAIASRFDRALEYYDQAIRSTRDPRLQALCWNGLGHAFTGLKEPQRAEEAFRRARSLDPANPGYAFDLAAALSNARQRLLAIETLRSVARQYPQNADACVRLGNVLVQDSQFDKALEVFQEALARDPACAAAYFNASVALAILGQHEKALAACQRALQLDPSLNAYYQLAILGGLENDARHLAFAEQRAAANDSVPLASRIDACFAAARVYDRRQDYDRAFRYLERGNRLKRGTLEFSIATETRRIDAIIEFFTREFSGRFTGRVETDLEPIFIVGMPRSGSTLLEQMLAAHPMVTACGELDYMTDIAHEVGLKWWSDSPSAPGSDAEIIGDLRRAVEKYRRSVSSLFDIQGRFTDKMLGNFLLLGLAHLMFPRGSLLHIRRHPMDLCFSCYQHLFTGQIPYAYDLVELGQYYLLYEKLMRHWQAVLPAKRILEVDYERLVGNPETEIRRILDYCGLPFDARCLQHDKVQRPVNTASHSQVRKPVYLSSVDRWRNYAEHLRPLAEILGEERV